MIALIVILAVLLILIFPIWAWRSEVREWNNGWCKCGGRWITFDMDSQGGVGHKCSRCSNGIWTSWINVSQRIEVE
jgi:hypothetical protein